MPIYRCECGGRLTRPLPHRCPYCHAVLTRQRRRHLISPWLVWLLAAAALALLVWFTRWWAG